MAKENRNPLKRHASKQELDRKPVAKAMGVTIKANNSPL
jgi:hypothetical protein